MEAPGFEPVPSVSTSQIPDRPAALPLSYAPASGSQDSNLVLLSGVISALTDELLPPVFYSQILEHVDCRSIFARDGRC